MGIKPLISIVYTLLIFSSNITNAEEFFEVSKQFYNNKDKVSAKNVSSYYWVFLKKNEAGQFYIDDETEMDVSESCFFRRLSLEKIKYNHFMAERKKFSLRDNIKSISKQLFVNSRIDTIVYQETTQKISVHVWGSKLPVIIKEKKEGKDIDPEKSLSVFCEKLGYNGMIVDVTKDIVTVVTSQSKKVDKTSQASVNGGLWL